MLLEAADLNCCWERTEDWDVLGPVDGQEEDPAGRLGHRLVVDVDGGGGGRGGDGEGGDGGGEDVEHLCVQGALKEVQFVLLDGGAAAELESLLELVKRVEHDELLLVVVPLPLPHVPHVLPRLLQQPGERGSPAGDAQ